MIRRLADEDFNGAITRGLIRREIEVVRVQDLGLRGAFDERVLEWAADARRIVLTHDRATLIATAYDRVRRGETMLGVIAVWQSLGVGRGILDVELIARCSEAEEWRDRVVYVPLS